MGLEKEQEVIMHAADMMIDVYTMESALLRAEKMLNLYGQPAAQIYMDIVKCFFFDAMDRININGKQALAAFAEGDELRIMIMGLKRFTKYEMVNTKNIRRAVADKLIAENGYCFWT